MPDPPVCPRIHRGERKRTLGVMSEDSGPASSAGQLSDFEKGQIVGAFIGGRSVADISEMYNVTSQTVSETLNLYKHYITNAKPGQKRRAGPGKAKNKTRTRCNGGKEGTAASEEGPGDFSGSKT